MLFYGAVLFLTLSFIPNVYSSSCLGNSPIGEWRDMEKGDSFPHNSVKGGNDRAVPLYICRVLGDKNFCGKSSVMGFCWVPDEGKERAFDKFQVLTGVQGVWAPIYNKYDKPCNVLKISEQNGVPIYSGRQHHPLNTLVVGQVKNSINYITYGGHAYSSEHMYEIFTAVPNNITLNGGHSRIFKVNGNYITFRLKIDDDSERSSKILLGSSKHNFRYQISISINALGSILLTLDDLRNGFTKTVENYNAANNFESFWIHWDNETIWLGEEGRFQARLKYDTGDTSNINVFKIMSEKESVWEFAYFEEAL